MAVAHHHHNRIQRLQLRLEMRHGWSALIRNFSMQAKTGACRTTKCKGIGARLTALCVAVWTCAHVMSEAVQGSNTANRRLFDAAANPPPGAVDADALEA